jgi:uncharacterized iron-regulated membrane protein
MSPTELGVSTCIVVLMMAIIGSWLWWLTQFFDFRTTQRLIVAVLGGILCPLGLCGAIWMSVQYINWLSDVLARTELREDARRAEADI